MKLITRIAAGVIFLANPAGGGEPKSDKHARDTIPVETAWGRFNVVDRILNLKSDQSVRWFYFGKDGSVSATLGIKGGAVTAPILSYRIIGEWLHIIDEDGKVVYQMRLVKIDKDEIVVDNGFGEKERYELSRNGPSQKK